VGEGENKKHAVERGKEWERERHAVERGTKGLKRERSPMQTRFPSAWEIVGLGSIHAGVACRRHAGV
jgi:hypothetical protein